MLSPQLKEDFGMAKSLNTTSPAGTAGDTNLNLMTLAECRQQIAQIEDMAAAGRLSTEQAARLLAELKIQLSLAEAERERKLATRDEAVAYACEQARVWIGQQKLSAAARAAALELFDGKMVGGGFVSPTAIAAEAGRAVKDAPGYARRAAAEDARARQEAELARKAREADWRERTRRAAQSAASKARAAELARAVQAEAERKAALAKLELDEALEADAADHAELLQLLLAEVGFDLEAEAFGAPIPWEGAVATTHHDWGFSLVEVVTVCRPADQATDARAERLAAALATQVSSDEEVLERTEALDFEAEVEESTHIVGRLSSTERSSVRRWYAAGRTVEEAILLIARDRANEAARQRALVEVRHRRGWSLTTICC